MPGTPTIDGVINLLGLEAAARPHLESAVHDYIAGGAADELTLAANRSGFDRLRLAPHVLVDVARRSAQTAVLGQSLAAPWLVAPTALHRLVHRDGELATARGAAAFGTTMVLSTLSTTAVEDVVRAAEGALWFQLYVYRDRGASEDLIRRVEAAGVKALVVTVDAPLLGLRERDGAHPVALPSAFAAPNVRADQVIEGGDLATTFLRLVDPALSWRDLAWLRSCTRLPILLKGILRVDDATRAVDEGIDGIVVSNHGGRQLDGVSASIDALGPIARAVEGRCALLMDGGVRRGTDVMKALALGADAVMLGRPILWGLAAAGAKGVHAVLGMLAAEFDLAQALCGCPDVGSISRDILAE
jgi:4-hydroxymandelate oxidase